MKNTKKISRSEFLASDVTNEQKVNSWLDRIGEIDQACRDEVINQCRTDKESMNYYLSRYNEK